MKKRKRKPDALMAYVGVMVEGHRFELGWTLHELAKVTGLNRNTLARIERGEANLRLDTLDAIAQALHLSPAELVPDRVATKFINGRKR